MEHRYVVGYSKGLSVIQLTGRMVKKQDGITTAPFVSRYKYTVKNHLSNETITFKVIVFSYLTYTAQKTTSVLNNFKKESTLIYGEVG